MTSRRFSRCFLILRPLVVDLSEPRLLLPCSQEPFGSRMKAGITRRAVHRLQLRQERLAIFERQLLLAKFPQTEIQARQMVTSASTSSCLRIAAASTPKGPRRWIK